ncbi:MAG: YdeI/OmpD-associated family protein [Rhizobium sp.]|nr:YdeI/OmpD-associated family protein [Rhizobium sp.]
MTTSESDPRVEAYIAGARTWRDEFVALRAIIGDCGLSEQFKWGHPCYTLANANIVLMHGFRDYCAILFFKGALMRDPAGILVQQTENVQAARQIRFTAADEIERMANVLKSYVEEAVAVEKAGLKVELRNTGDFPVPEEFREWLERMPDLRLAFDVLTPGRQRAYLLHFAGAKQAATRNARIDKNIPNILAGKGLGE